MCIRMMKTTSLQMANYDVLNKIDGLSSQYTSIEGLVHIRRPLMDQQCVIFSACVIVGYAIYQSALVCVIWLSYYHYHRCIDNLTVVYIIYMCTLAW